MEKIYFTSDLHLLHNKDFVVDYRGFTNIEEHDRTLVTNWNNLVTDEDDVYLLGDVMLKDVETGLSYLRQLKGRIHIIRGNHDTDEKMKRYAECENVVELADAKYLRVTGGPTLYLSHYPTLVSHDRLKKYKQAVISLFGHTHQKENFYTLNGEEHPYMYHVGVDSHNLTPVLLEDILEEIKAAQTAYFGRHQEQE